MTTNESPRELPGRQWVAIAVVVGCIVVLAGLLLPAIHNARQAARRTQSKNNLKQLGLGLFNYHDTNLVLPIGGDIQADGTAKHGWYTRLIPYLEATDLYSRINFNLPWDHPVQDYLFKQPFGSNLIPGIDQRLSTDGYGLLHYMANPNAMHRNHCISLDDMTTGTANNWLCGEAAGNYQLWGYPFNRRPLHPPLNSGPSIYGVWPDGGFLCLADGSVRFSSNTTDATLLTSLSNAPPVATKQQTIVPDHRTESTLAPLRRQWFEAKVGENQCKGTPGTTITFDRANRPYFADLFGVRDNDEPIWDVDHTMRIDLQGVLEHFPEIRMLDVSVVNDENAAIIAQFPNLEFLQASTYDLSEKGDAILKACPKLKTIVHR
jgi:hypothetical protein